MKRKTSDDGLSDDEYLALVWKDFPLGCLCSSILGTVIGIFIVLL